MSAPSLAGVPAPAWDRAAFLARLGHLFEHSPWVVERAYEKGPFVDGEALLAAFAEVVATATKDEQLDLLRRHPELADKAAIDARALTAESANEQTGAGLDRLTLEEYEAFDALNRAYRTRFGFPFVICVRLYDKAGILSALKARTAGEGDELGVALENVLLIVRFRLADVLGAA